MKHLILIITSLFILISGFVFSQEFPTRGEIYNYDIGDIFHIHEYASAPGSGFSATVNIEILEKYYSENGDTVFYNQLNKRLESGSEYPNPVYTEEEEIIYYTSLNEIFMADSIIEDLDVYNGRITLFNFVVFPDHFYEDRYVVGCGHVYHEYMCYYPEVFYEVQLVYFNKGGEEWGEEQLIIGTPELSNIKSLKIYPNPSNTYITLELPPITTETTLYITDIFGKTIAELPLIKGQTQLVWNCSNIASGVYFYQTEIAGVVYRGKIVVN